jgi:UDP-3-O-[3-hydroxymyristoyl] glucosamine N-acyltransferase
MTPPRPITGARLLEFLGDRVFASRGESMCLIRGTAPVLPGQPEALSFIALTARASTAALGTSASSALLVSADMFTEIEFGGFLIAVADPRREFARVIAEYFAPDKPIGIAASAVVSPTAAIGAGCYVGPGALIGDGVVIGDHCTIGANAAINVASIGDHTTIGPNTTIGNFGFGYVREDDGTPLHIPHSGGVRIGSYVDIGANTCVDRGALADTVIRDHAKVDNLVHIAHNCDIGEGAYIIATSVLCGSVRIGARASIAANSSVLEGVQIGADAVVGLGAVVLVDVPDGVTVVGNPAQPITSEN